jgi:hypothetical protein
MTVCIYATILYCIIILYYTIGVKQLWTVDPRRTNALLDGDYYYYGTSNTFRKASGWLGRKAGRLLQLHTRSGWLGVPVMVHHYFAQVQA